MLVVPPTERPFPARIAIGARDLPVVQHLDSNREIIPDNLAKELFRISPIFIGLFNADSTGVLIQSDVWFAGTNSSQIRTLCWIGSLM
jgi:hypothetical protein